MRTLEISDETFEKIKDQIGYDFKEIDSLEDLIGGKFFFRTITYHMLGRVKKVSGKIITLESSSWIADSGRFSDAIKKGELNEVEPVGESYLNFDSVVDFFAWKHDLPKEQK